MLDYEIFHAHPNHGYPQSQELDTFIEQQLAALSSKFKVPTPQWTWTAINTHFEPAEQMILISDYVVDIWNKKPDYREPIKEVVAWETSHMFKHYLDNYRFRIGDPKGRKIMRHVERKRWLYGLIPTFEKDAIAFAAQTTGIIEAHYDQLYVSIQPWNIPGYEL